MSSEQESGEVWREFLQLWGELLGSILALSLAFTAVAGLAYLAILSANWLTPRIINVADSLTPVQEAILSLCFAVLVTGFAAFYEVFISDGN